MDRVPPPAVWLPYLLLWLGGACALSAGVAAVMAVSGRGQLPLAVLVVPPLLVLVGFVLWLGRQAIREGG